MEGSHTTSSLTDRAARRDVKSPTNAPTSSDNTETMTIKEPQESDSQADLNATGRWRYQGDTTMRDLGQH